MSVDPTTGKIFIAFRFVEAGKSYLAFSSYTFSTTTLELAWTAKSNREFSACQVLRVSGADSTNFYLGGLSIGTSATLTYYAFLAL